MLQLSPEEVRKSPLFLIGTPEECAQELKRREREWELGETIFAARGADVLKRLATEVLPLL
jgi:alkanesulfonate monooxygenase SsuD/methylene tetrahydromethanopterin reductase-like flavin-dependent oxidoreductase (luciferase family)